MNFSHVGIVSIINGTPMVYEAYPPSVQLIDLKVFLNRSLDTNNKPKVIVGRLKKNIANLLEALLVLLKIKLVPNMTSFFCTKTINSIALSYFMMLF